MTSNNVGNSFDGHVSLSPGFDADPFADNFFQTSFGSLTTTPGSEDNTGAVDLFASIPPPVVADPFSSPASTLPPLETNLSTVFDDPFASPSVSSTAETTAPSFPSNDGFSAPASTSSPTVDASDPFSTTIATPSADISVSGFGTDDFGSNFTTSETPTSAATFEANFPELPRQTTPTVPPPATTAPLSVGAPPARGRPSSRLSSSSLPPISADAFQTDFSELTIATTTSPAIAPPTNTQATPTVAPSQVQASSIPFEPDFFEPAMTGISTPPPTEAPPPLPDSIQPPPVPVTTPKRLSGPPPLPPRKTTPARPGSRPRGKVPDFVSTEQNTPQTTSSSVNSELFSLQITNSVFQQDTTSSVTAPFPTTQVTETLPTNFQLDPSWGTSNFQSPTASLQPGPMPLEEPPVFPVAQGTGFFDPVQQSFPVDPNWGGNNFQLPPSVPPVIMDQQSFPPQEFAQPQVNMFQENAQAVYQFPVQAPPIIHPHPPQMDSGIYSPPQTNSFMSNASDDLSNNPFAGDFNSPPFALHSSTPQSPGPGGSNGYPPHQSPSPPAASPPRPIIEGPDPFAELLPLALSPSKDGKKDDVEPPAPVEVVETPQTTQPKKPTLNDLYNNKHGFDSLGNDVPKTDSIPEQSFNNDFGADNSSWIAF